MFVGGGRITGSPHARLIIMPFYWPIDGPISIKFALNIHDNRWLHAALIIGSELTG